VIAVDGNADRSPIAWRTGNRDHPWAMTVSASSNSTIAASSDAEPAHFVGTVSDSLEEQTHTRR
jgi:hypothetical protein